jgi:hypothetical protein
MATRKTTPAKKRRSSSRDPLLREVDAIDFQTLSALTYYPSVAPEGDGQMPILAAVHWIASEGLKLDHDLLSIAGESHYCDSAKALFRKVASEKVRVRGENLDEDSEQIASAAFDDDLVPVFDFAEGPPRYVRRLELNVSDGDQSMDILFKAKNRGSWTNVKVFCEDVRREWPFGVAAPSSKQSQGKTPKITRYLVDRFNGAPVPPPSEISRKGLRADLLSWDTMLAPLDPQTLQTAIKNYNKTLKPN